MNIWVKSKKALLVLAHVELIFFTVAGVGYVLDLCWKKYWYCRDIFIIAKQCLHRAKVLSDSHITPPVSKLGMYKNLGGDAGTADPNSARGHAIPYGVMLSIYSWRKKKMGNARSDGICLPRSPLHPMEPCLPVGHSELIPLFALIMQVDFALPIKLYLSQSTSLLTLPFWFSLTSHWSRKWVRVCVWLSCWLGSNHNKDTNL